MRVERHGSYIVYSHPGCMGSDLIVRPNPLIVSLIAAAEVIALGSYFMDYGHFLKAFEIDEDQFQSLSRCKTWEELEDWLDSIWPKEEKA